MATIWDLLALALFTILILLALGGNVLVCVAVFWDRKLRRQPENLFLVSLAVSDLLVSLLVMVFAAANDLLGYWPFGSAYCQFWICFDITCSTASILNLCAIAFDRYLHISRPMTYARYSNRGVIMISIVLVWLLSSLIGSAQIIFGVAGGEALESRSPIDTATTNALIEDEPTGVTSSSEVCHLMLQPLYAIFSSTLSFFLPATIMILLYTKLYIYARMHVRSIRAQLKQATSLLIMQLASDRIRQVVVRPCFLASHTALHYANSRDNGCNCNGTVDVRDRQPDGHESMNKNCTSLMTTVTATAGELHDSVSATAIPSTATVKATIKATSACVANCSAEQTCNMEFVEVSDECQRLNGRNNHNSMISHTGRSVSDQKARFTLGVIMGTFLLCWLPFFIINIWRSLYPDFFPQLAFQGVSWLGYANSTANPIIYGIFNRDFRRAFKCALWKIFYCCDDNAYKRRTSFMTGYKC